MVYVSLSLFHCTRLCNYGFDVVGMTTFPRLDGTITTITNKSKSLPHAVIAQLRASSAFLVSPPHFTQAFPRIAIKRHDSLNAIRTTATRPVRVRHQITLFFAGCRNLDRTPQVDMFHRYDACLFGTRGSEDSLFAVVPSPDAISMFVIVSAVNL